MHFKDNKFTGFKNFSKDLLHHVEVEPLVLHSWTYGTPPPLSHEEIVAKVKEWIEKGQPFLINKQLLIMKSEMLTI